MGGNLFLIIIFCVAAVTVAYFIIEHQRKFFGTSDKNTNDNGLEGFTDNPLSEIFYLYDHDSEKHWRKWIGKQDRETRTKAAEMLTAHLDNQPKFWGYVTLEVLEALKGFNDMFIDHFVANFFSKTGKMWGELKMVPNYYEKAGSTLVHLNPQSAVIFFKEEVERKSNSQGGLERKKIIIDIIPELGSSGVNLLIEIINDANETLNTRLNALNAIHKYGEAEDSRKIILETFRYHINKFKSLNREPKTEDSQILQALISESISMISDYEFFEVFALGCENYILRDFIIDPFIRRLNDMNNRPSKQEIFALMKLQDNENNELKRALSKRAHLEVAEVNNICIQKVAKGINIETLTNTHVDDHYLPVPEVIQKQYDDFKDAFFKSKSSDIQCDKNYGGVLVAGDGELEKLFFSKALAQQQKYGFSVFDIKELQDSDSYNTFCTRMSSLKKPYLIYIKNPDLLFNDEHSKVNQFRQRFQQTLYIQVIDSKTLIVGDICKKIEDLKTTHYTNAIQTLRSKYFSQVLEVNDSDENARKQIIEDYLKHINTHRFDNRSEFVNEMLKRGEEMNYIEFIFFVLETLNTMLIVFHRSVPYREVEKLIKEFEEGKKTIIDEDLDYEENEIETSIESKPNEEEVTELTKDATQE